MIQNARQWPSSIWVSRCAGSLSKNLLETNPWLIYLFWQEGIVIVPKQQKPHFTPKSANSETNGRQNEPSLTSSSFLEFTWEDCSSRLQERSVIKCLARSQGLPQRKVEILFVCLFCFSCIAHWECCFLHPLWPRAWEIQARFTRPPT